MSTDYRETKELKEQAEKIRHEKWVRANKEIATAEVDNEIENAKLICRRKRVQNQMENTIESERLARECGEAESLKNLSTFKSSGFCLGISIVATLISIFMSCAGISYCSSPHDLFMAIKGDYWLPVLVTAVAQLGVVWYSQNSYVIGKHIKNGKVLIDMLRICIYTLSIWSNHEFIISMIPLYNSSFFGKFIGWMVAASADIVSFSFSYLANRMKNHLYDIDDILAQDTGYLSKIFVWLTGWFRKTIDQKYYATVNDLNEFYAKNKDLAKLKNSSTVVSSSVACTTVTKKVHAKTVSNEKLESATKKKDVQDVKPLNYYPTMKPQNLEKYISIIEPLPVDAQISKSLLGIEDVKEWRKVREYLNKNNIVYCRNKATFKC